MNWFEKISQFFKAVVVLDHKISYLVEVVKRLEDNDLKIAAMKMIHMTLAQAEGCIGSPTLFILIAGALSAGRSPFRTLDVVGYGGPSWPKPPSGRLTQAA